MANRYLKYATPQSEDALRPVNGFSKYRGPSALPGPRPGNRYELYRRAPELAAPKSNDGKTDRGDAPGRGTATIMGATNTAGFAFNDEMGAGLASVVDRIVGDDRSLQELYDENLKVARHIDKRTSEEYPAQYLAGQAGGIAATLPFQVVVRGGNLLYRTGRAAYESAKQGLAYGLGSGEGGIEDRAISGAKGAATGALVSTVLRPIASAGGKVVQMVKAPFQKADEYAGRKVTQAATRAGTTIPNAMQEVNRLQKTNPDTRLVDVLGNPGMRLARAVHTKGGLGGEKVTKFMHERQLEQGPRVTNALKTSLGNPDAYYQSLDDALLTLKTSAKPFYERAYATNINYMQHGPAITMAWSRVPLRLRSKVVAAANDLLVAEGSKAKPIGDVIGRGKDGKVTPQPTLEQWDYIKRGLDAVIEGTEGQAASGGMSALGRSLTLVKNDLLKVLDKAVPDYAQARKIYSDDLSVKRAIEEGRKAINLDPELISRKLASLDTAAADMFRLGYARAVNDAASK